MIDNDRKWMDSVCFGRFRIFRCSRLLLLACRKSSKICWNRKWLGSYCRCSGHLSRPWNTQEEVAAVRDALEIDIDVDSSVERDGTPLSASSLVLDWCLMLRVSVSLVSSTNQVISSINWYAREFLSMGNNVYPVTVRYLQAAVGWGAPAAERHVCKYLLQQHEA